MANLFDNRNANYGKYGSRKRQAGRRPFQNSALAEHDLSTYRFQRMFQKKH